MINTANFVHLLGRVTRDPEKKTTPAGISYCRFTVAVDRGYAKPGEEKQTDFIDCVAWRQTADFVSKWFHKGDVIELVGGIEVRSYMKDDEKRWATEVVCEQVSFVPGTKNAGRSSETSQKPSGGIAVVDDQSDDPADGDGLPF